MLFKTRRMTPGISRQRMIIRGFKTEDTRQRHIREIKSDPKRNNTLFIKEYSGELPPGTYAFVSGEWRNVKTIDKNITPHV